MAWPLPSMDLATSPPLALAATFAERDFRLGGLRVLAADLTADLLLSAWSLDSTKLAREERRKSYLKPLWE